MGEILTRLHSPGQSGSVEEIHLLQGPSFTQRTNHRFRPKLKNTSHFGVQWLAWSTYDWEDPGSNPTSVNLFLKTCPSNCSVSVEE